MAKAYSEDLRGRVLKYLEEGNDKESTANLFSIGIATLYRWIKLKKETGHLQVRQRTVFRKTIENEKLKVYIEEHPDAFLWEIAQHFSVTVQSIFYALRRLKITRKKRQRFIQKEMKKRERSL